MQQIQTIIDMVARITSQHAGGRGANLRAAPGRRAAAR